MLKHIPDLKQQLQKIPAAFRRLCVETIEDQNKAYGAKPAAFRRLCVETYRPLAYRRRALSSRLQAAVC